LLSGCDDEIESVAAIDSLLRRLRPAVTHADMMPANRDRVLRVAVSELIVPAPIGAFGIGLTKGALRNVIAVAVLEATTADGALSIAEPQRSGQAIRESETNGL
jgi:hypothetical protein